MGRSSHLALMEMSIFLTIVRITHEVHLIDILACALGKELHGILIAEIIRSLYGVKGM